MGPVNSDILDPLISFPIYRVHLTPPRYFGPTKLIYRILSQQFDCQNVGSELVDLQTKIIWTLHQFLLCYKTFQNLATRAAEQQENGLSHNEKLPATILSPCQDVPFIVNSVICCMNHKACGVAIWRLPRNDFNKEKQLISS